MLKSRNDLETTQMTADLRLTDEPAGFNASEMLACARCGRQSGPDREACLYCGENFPVTEHNPNKAALELRRLETWEPGFSLIARSRSTFDDSNLSAAAKLIGMDKSVLDSIFDSKEPLPLARVESKEVANEAVKTLSDLGFTADVINESDLKFERPPVRLRNLGTEGSQLVLTDFNSAKLTMIDLAEVILMVTGRVFETRRDEVTKRSKGKSKIVDETETGSDLRLIDVYTSTDVIGYRIQTNGFDFSILGEDKGMLANENIERLGDFLERQCPNAVIAAEFDLVRTLLGAVWEPETRKDTQLRGYDKRKFATTYTSSNLSQFTKYSRMRRLLI
jgi:hypothetical protein